MKTSDTTNTIPEATFPPTKKGKLIVNAYANVHCSGCGRGIPRGDDIAYFPNAERGWRVWHPACVTAEPDVLAVIRAVSQARHAADVRAMHEGDDVRRRLIVEAYRAVCEWLTCPDMWRLRELLIAKVTAKATAPVSATPAPTAPAKERGSRPLLRLVQGGHGR